MSWNTHLYTTYTEYKGLSNPKVNFVDTGNFFIKCSNFQKLDAGALYITQEGSLEVQESHFNEINDQNYASCIFADYSGLLDIKISRCCFSECQIESITHIIVDIKVGESSDDNIEMSSVVYCINSACGFDIIQKSAMPKIINLNESGIYSLIHAGPSQDGDSIIKWSTFSNATATQGIILYLFNDERSGYHRVSKSIIVDCKAFSLKYDSYSTIFTDGISYVNDCCLLRNSGMADFGRDGKKSSHIFITNCMTNQQSVNGIEIVVSNVEETVLPHLNLGNCLAKLPIPDLIQQSNGFLSNKNIIYLILNLIQY